MAKSYPRLLVIRTLPVALTVLLFATAAVPVAAQTIVGGRQQPEVTVDLSVLDALGPAPTLPDLLRGQTAQRRGALQTAGRRIALHPPKTKKKAAAAPKTEQTAAARRAAPIAPVAASGTATPRESVTAAPLAEAKAGPAAEAAPPETRAATPPAKSATAEATPPAATAAAPAAPAAPKAAPPSPVPVTPAPSPTTVAVIDTPPSVPPAASVKPTPVAAPATVAAAAGDHTRIVFASGATDLPDDAKAGLDALARQLGADGHLRLQLAAYAGGAADQANQARRISLQRALAVRSYLMEHGVANTRMDVRALGNHAEGSEPPDRVDVVMLER